MSRAKLQILYRFYKTPDLKMSRRKIDALLRIKNLECGFKWAWSFLAAPNGLAGGWVEGDEAVGIVHDARTAEE
jgi:hypothetical protein